MIQAYGYDFPDGTPELHVELACFRWALSGEAPLLNAPFHFQRVAKILWGSRSKRHYVWNPWNTRMLEGACKYRYTWLSGCAASGKSTFGAIWALVNWLALPRETLVLIASTTISEARGRIWGEVEEYFNAANDSLNAMHKGLRLPGKMVSSVGKIRTEEGARQYSDRCGIQLIAADRSHEKEALKKIGFHNKRVLVVLDELTDLSPTMVDAAKANLAVNPWFQLTGIGNFASIYDPLGINAEPVSGWASITDDYDEWETKGGRCLRFDGMKSPNVLEGHVKYPGLYGPEDLKNHRQERGENTAAFWRMCRSFPCPEADADRVYSHADLLKGDVRGTVRWLTTPVDCAALDPAFATGGDRAMACFAQLGTSVDGKQTLQVVETKEYREDIRKKDQSRPVQVARQFIEDCKARGIKPANIGFDGSGGGMVFGPLMCEIWPEARAMLSVQFGGAAGDLPASIKDPRPAKQVFSNRVSEIWFQGVGFVQSGQIKGLTSQCCSELTERRKHKRDQAIVHNRVESKDEMKRRTNGKSPDDADAFLILLTLARERLGFVESGMEGNRRHVANTWQQQCRKANRIYRHEHGFQPA